MCAGWCGLGAGESRKAEGPSGRPERHRSKTPRAGSASVFIQRPPACSAAARGRQQRPVQTAVAAIDGATRFAERIHVRSGSRLVAATGARRDQAGPRFIFLACKCQAARFPPRYTLLCATDVSCAFPLCAIHPSAPTRIWRAPGLHHPPSPTFTPTR